MDNRIRRNEKCIVGLPRCDYVFSSTRSCFVAYGFEESPLEVDILKNINEERGIETVEAGGSLAPGQNAFCSKICSKIIVSQYCVVLLNNNEEGKTEIPNANVNMEYGLMLGFNKYVIPFQRASQKLPFNVSGLDTIKYTDKEFNRLASSAIDQAILDTQQKEPQSSLGIPDQVLHSFLLKKRAVVAYVDNEGDRAIFRLGSPLGFNLLNDFSGLKYMFLGNFTFLRPEVVIWRVKTLVEILTERRLSIKEKITDRLTTPESGMLAESILSKAEIWLMATSDNDREMMEKETKDLDYKVSIFTLEDVKTELDKI